MTSRGRPSRAIGGGGSAFSSTNELEGTPISVAQVRASLLAMRELPCFQGRPDNKMMIENVVNCVLPIVEAVELAGKDHSSTYQLLGYPVLSDRKTLPPPPLPPPPSTMDRGDNNCQGQAGGGWGASLGHHAPPFLSTAGKIISQGWGGLRRESDMPSITPSSVTAAAAAVPTFKVTAMANTAGGRHLGLLSLPNRAWTMTLDYVDLKEVMSCRRLGRVYRQTVEESLSVLALSGVNSLTWATPENLLFLTRFKNVRTLHWYVGVGMPRTTPGDGGQGNEVGPEDGSGANALVGLGLGLGEAGAGGGGGLNKLNREGANQGEGALTTSPRLLSIEECNPVRAWAYLLGALPKIDEVIIVEGRETDEAALEEVWKHLLPLCTNLRSFFLNFEDYRQCAIDGDHPPIDVKKFAVFLQSRKPFPKLRELHLELGSMSVSEQRSLIRGLSMSGLLPRLEKMTLGDGTTSYVRNRGRGPGRDLYQAFKKNCLSSLRVLWLQRLDLWDDLEGLAAALGPAHCPVMKELFLDLALDTEDVQRLADCLHKFPPSLKTLGVLSVAIKNRTDQGDFEFADPTPALSSLASALMMHPRPSLQCIDISLHFEDTAEGQVLPDGNQGAIVQPDHAGGGGAVQGGGGGGEDLGDEGSQVVSSFVARASIVPIINLLKSGVLTGLKHVQLSCCCLDDNGLFEVSEAVAMVPGLQTLDLSNNQLSIPGLRRSIPVLKQCRNLHEVVLERTISLEDEEEMQCIVKEHLPWMSFPVEDREGRRGSAARLGGQYFDDGMITEDEFDEDDESIEDDGSDGEVPAELMMDDDSD